MRHGVVYQTLLEHTKVAKISATMSDFVEYYTRKGTRAYQEMRYPNVT